MRIVDFVQGWLNRYFAHEESVLLVLIIVAGLVVVTTLGGVLAPVLTALIIAFVLQGLLARLKAWRVPETMAVYLSYAVFITVLVVLLVIVLPLIWRQLYAFVNAIPGVVEQAQGLLRDLPERYPEFVTQTQIDQWTDTLEGEFVSVGQRLIGFLFGSIGSVVGIIIYLVLVPLLVLFFLKDRALLLGWVKGWLPAQRPLLDQVGEEMNIQIANYVRGKAIEIIIVGGTTYLVFGLLGLNYAALLGVLVGLSVIVPYIGAAVVTIPVALVGFGQFGWSADFAWVMAAYAVIQALDGNALVPVLFSEAVDLHPVAIIVAVLAFGGIWGFWGVFFAIPLASLVKAVLTAWPESVADVRPPPPTA